MWKVAGAKAATGASLDEVVAVAQKAIDSTRSVGIGLSPCTLPAVGRPNFKIEEGTMELGIGHHGEPGVEVCALETADKIAARMFGILHGDDPYSNGDDVAVLVSGLGATPAMELYVLFTECAKLLKKQGVSIYKSYVGDYFTSLDMKGASITIMKLDDALKALLDAPAHSAGFWQE